MLLDFRYAVPVTARDTTVAFQYRRNDLVVVEEPFADLDLESESEIFGLSVRHPVYRRPGTVLAVELIGEQLSDETTLLGVPFSLEPGADNGESVVTALRAVQEFVHRTHWLRDLHLIARADLQLAGTRSSHWSRFRSVAGIRSAAWQLFLRGRREPGHQFGRLLDALDDAGGEEIAPAAVAVGNDGARGHRARAEHRARRMRCTRP